MANKHSHKPYATQKLLNLIKPQTSCFMVLLPSHFLYCLIHFSKSTQWHHCHCSGMTTMSSCALGSSEDYNWSHLAVNLWASLHRRLCFPRLPSSPTPMPQGLFIFPCLLLLLPQLVLEVPHSPLQLTNVTILLELMVKLCGITHNNTEMSSHGYWFGTPVIQISSSLSNQLIAYITHSNANERFLGSLERFCTIWERLGD